MRSRIELSLQLLCSVVIAVVSTACASAPRADRYVAPPQGSSWVFAVRDSGSFGSANTQTKSTMGEQSWQGRNLLAFQGPQQTTLAEPANGHWVAQVAGTRPLVSWDPPIGWNWPISVGNAWTRDHRITVHESGQTTSFVGSWKVESYEAVTVPAGTFNTFKISYSDDIGTENVIWFSPDLGIFVKTRIQRTSKYRLGPGLRETELVSHTIRR